MKRATLFSAVGLFLVGCGFVGGPSVIMKRGASTMLYIVINGDSSQSGIQPAEIDQTTGKLTLVGSVVTVDGAGFLTASVSPDGTYLYGADANGNVWTFPILASGALGTPFLATALNSASQVLTDPLGGYLFGVSGFNAVNSYSLSSGKATLINSISLPQVFFIGIVFHPTSYFMYLPIFAATASPVAIVSMDYLSGKLTRQTSVEPPVQDESPSILSLHPGGAFLYANGTAPFYSVNTSTGALTPQTGTALIDNDGAFMVDPSGQWLYAADSTGSVCADTCVHAYAINASSGALTELSTSPYVVPGASFQLMDIDGKSRFLYIADSNSDVVWSWSINSKTGSLTPIGTGNFPIGIQSVISVTAN